MKTWKKNIIAALILACANRVTAPIIEKNQAKRTAEAMHVVMPEADEFEKVEVIAEKSAVTEAYNAKNSSGEKIGSCVIAGAYGYGGEVLVLVGIDSEQKITGIQIMSHSETPGLGANAQKPEFTGQFTGKTSGIKAVKSNAGENEINAMSGATITSRAVTSAVSEALEFVKNNQ